MPDSEALRFTSVDLDLAQAYVPLLIDLAKVGGQITYGGLVNRAKETYPDNPSVQSAIAVSTGRRLEAVRKFTSAQKLPDLTCLVVNAQTGAPGAGFTRVYDSAAAQEKVRAYDWSNVPEAFYSYVEETRRRIVPLQTREREEALNVMFAHYTAHKSELPTDIVSKREPIVALLMEGLSAEDAFRDVCLEG